MDEERISNECGVVVVNIIRVRAAGNGEDKLKTLLMFFLCKFTENQQEIVNGQALMQALLAE